MSHGYAYILDSGVVLAKAGEILECLRSMSAVVKPLAQRKNWKHTKKKCTRVVVAANRCQNPASRNHLLFLAFHSLSRFMLISHFYIQQRATRAKHQSTE